MLLGVGVVGGWERMGVVEERGRTVVTGPLEFESSTA